MKINMGNCCKGTSASDNAQTGLSERKTDDDAAKKTDGEETVSNLQGMEQPSRAVPVQGRTPNESSEGYSDQFYDQITQQIIAILEKCLMEAISRDQKLETPNITRQFKETDDEIAMMKLRITRLEEAIVNLTASAELERTHGGHGKRWTDRIRTIIKEVKEENELLSDDMVRYERTKRKYQQKIQRNMDIAEKSDCLEKAIKCQKKLEERKMDFLDLLIRAVSDAQTAINELMITL